MPSLYKVYFDESGTHADSEAVVLAGFVSNETQWNAFSEKWQEVLNDCHLDYFRMSQFANKRGQFSGWTEDARRDLLGRLLTIIDAHTFWSVACIVFREWFDTILCSAAKQILGDPYGLAALSCWRNLGLILREHDAWMDCLMESGAKGSGVLQLIYEEDSKIPEWRNNHRIISLSFPDKRACLPLQAADLLAYEIYKDVPRQFRNGTRQARYPLEALGRKRHQCTYYQESLLRELNDDLIEQLARPE